MRAVGRDHLKSMCLKLMFCDQTRRCPFFGPLQPLATAVCRRKLSLSPRRPRQPLNPSAGASSEAQTRQPTPLAATTAC